MKASQCCFSVLSLSPAVWAYTWPDKKIDRLEQLLYEGGTTYGVLLLPCSIAPAGSAPGSGRTNAAEWLRTAFHDVATADVSKGTGGIDASLAFEMDRGQNIGSAIPTTIEAYRVLQSERVSMSDIIALGAALAVQACSDGKVKIPYRAGRVDATSAGPTGVPEPHEDIKSHTDAFARAGFNVTDMIGLVACGHTLGGVHGVDFPDITPGLVSDGSSQARRGHPEHVVGHQLQNRTDTLEAFDQTNATFDNRV